MLLSFASISIAVSAADARSANAFKRSASSSEKIFASSSVSAYATPRRRLSSSSGKLTSARMPRATMLALSLSESRSRRSER